MFVRGKEYVREIDGLTNLFYALADRLTMLEDRVALIERTLSQVLLELEDNKKPKKPATKKVAAAKRTQK